jgi:hypothetical protein
MPGTISSICLITLPVLLICACSDADNSEKAQHPSFNNTRTMAEDSVAIPSFEIQLELSPAAEKLLHDKMETVIVMAYFSGVRRDSTNKADRQRSEYFLGKKAIELDNSRIAGFRGLKLARKDLDSIAGSDYQVLVNIYSGRLSTNVNLLDCGMIQAPISEIKGTRQLITGKLVKE